MYKEYQVVYDFGNYRLTVGNPVWIPVEEIAKKIRDRKQKEPLYADRNLYIIGRVQEGELPEMKMYDGKPVYEHPFLFWDGMDVGDYVTAEVAYDMGDCVPPAYYSRTMIQCGEPYSHVFGKPTYLTLERVNKDVWRFLGYCYRGKKENLVIM